LVVEVPRLTWKTQAGAVVTYFLVPETRDHDGKSRTLEVLACGKRVLDDLNKQRAQEED